MPYQTKKAAQQAGEEVLKLLNEPDGWEICIIENFGWHVSLFKQGMTLIRCLVNEKFTVLMNFDNRKGAGEHYLSVCNTFSDPNKAIQKQIDEVDKFIKKIKDVRERHE